jgi:hypothetical protein
MNPTINLEKFSQFMLVTWEIFYFIPNCEVSFASKLKISIPANTVVKFR